MAQDYVILNDNSENGLIAINKSVFQSIVEISVDDLENTVRVSETRFNRPLQVKIEKNKLFVETDIKVKYGANVAATCELLQNKIYENIQFMTGFKASDVTVHVIGFDI